MLESGALPSEIRHVEHLPGRPAQHAAWPTWIPDALAEALTARGITAPYTHQAEAAELIQAGRDVVIATATASGKSLAYQLPILTALLTEAGRRAGTALYLAPTKALAADQLSSVNGLNLSVATAAYDGDTQPAYRDWARANGRWIFTNPDMVHSGILPAHKRWSTLLRNLCFVVIDECHTYHGVFGSHVAVLLRRLRRLATRYGSEPIFILTSATVAEPAEFAQRLIGKPVAVIDNDGSPRGPLAFTLCQPPELESDQKSPPARRTVTAHAAHRLAELVTENRRSLVFTRSRRTAELVSAQAQELVPARAERIAAYRAGYLADDRRQLEGALREGSLLGVAATTALELGVNISGLDAVVIAGFPGTLAGLWQQAGRAGRNANASTAEFIARPDPLDTYLVRNPAAIFGRPIEARVLDPSNPYVLGPQLACAAAEAPLTNDDLALFDGDTQAALTALERAKLVRSRPTGWHWVGRHRPTIGLRGDSGKQISIVDAETGQLLGSTEALAATTSLHDGAVYLHQGHTYVVETLDLGDLVALVRAANPDYTTFARQDTQLSITGIQHKESAAGLELCFGSVEVTSQVTSYLRRRIGTGEVIDENPLDLPARELPTKAIWITGPTELLRHGDDDLAGSLHAAEHAAIGMLPLFASCDRWDIGGLSTALHADTAAPTIFVYDGHRGGAGFAERAFGIAAQWLAATRQAVTQCHCVDGCPSCVYSPKCGNGNSPLDKAGAARLLTTIVSSLQRR